MNAPVKSTETQRRSTTRVTSRMARPQWSLRDFATVEQFVFDHGRAPKGPEDGPAWQAVVRGRAANLAAQVKTPAQPGEPPSIAKWRRRTAAKALIALAKTSRPAHRIVQRAAAERPRETSGRRRRGDATSLGGDSGDPPRPPDDDVARPRRAASAARERSTTASQPRSPWREWCVSIVASDRTANARLVAFVLALHWERNGGVCASSVTTLARETGLSYSSVQRALAELVRAGLIERERGGRGKPDRYSGSAVTGTAVREGSW